MPVDASLVDRFLPFLPQDLRALLADEADLAEAPKGTTLLREGQYVKVIPIVLEGLVRVFTSTDGKELLLYFIKPSESCVMSFSAIINNDTSRIHAIIEEDALLLLLPSHRIPEWTRTYPRLNDLFFQQYNARYNELIDTIQHLLFNRMDQRLYDYLKEMSRIKSSPIILIRHREIAQHLGTAREVVTRTLKKLETEGKVSIVDGGIMLN